MNQALLATVLRSTLRRALPIIGVFALMGALPAGAAPAADQAASPHHGVTSDHPHAGELVRIVREATERFKDVEVAKQDGYGLLFGCVSGGDSGAMGLHFVNLGRWVTPLSTRDGPRS